MRKIILIAQVTLDGVVQGPGGPDEDRSGGFSHGGWALAVEEPMIEQEVNALMSRDFDLLLGRRTYEIWTAYWPYHTDNVIGAAFDKATKHVATNTLHELEWQPAKRLSGDIVSEVKKLKESDGPEIHIWGSFNLVQTLIAAGLIDEYRLWVYPIIIGQGKRLFEHGVPPGAFTLTDSQRTPKGLMINVYHPNGELRVGNALDDSPSEKELARRKKHASEDAQ
jgi:dihydrofolate reductase